MSEAAKKPNVVVLDANGGGALSLPLVIGGDASVEITEGTGAQSLAPRAELEQLVTQLFEELGRPLVRYVRGFVRDPVVSRDLVQEVFVRLCAELSAGRSVTDVRAWLFRVAHNLAIDDQRRLRVLESHESSVDPADIEFVLSDPAPSAENELLRRERHGWLRGALSSLSAQERRCVFLRAQGLRYREIAAVLDIRIPTVVTFLTRAIQKLKKARP
ncbi:MAG: RNA polymerase sigma factor [Vicinamibacterales bacterium]